MIAAPRAFVARGVRGLALGLVAVALAGCSTPSWWPWGASKPKRPDAPAVAQTIPARVAWSVRVGPGGVGFAPAVAGDAVYAAALDGSVFRIDSTNGGVVWRADAGTALASGVGTDGTSVVVAARNGSLIALDADGRRKWSVPMGAEATSVPSVGSGLVVVRTADNRVSAFDVTDGRRRWTFQRQNPPLVLRQTGTAVITGRAAFVGLPGGRVVSLDLQNGALHWETAVAQPRGSTEIERIADVVGAPVVSAREVCAVAFQGRIACLDAETGRPLWSREVSSPTGLDVDARVVATVDDKDVVHAFSRTGVSLWKQEALSRRGVSAPLSLGPALVVGDVEGNVYLVSREDGALAARFASDSTPITASPVAAGRAGVVQTAGGTVLAVVLE